MRNVGSAGIFTLLALVGLFGETLCLFNQTHGSLPESCCTVWAGSCLPAASVAVVAGTFRLVFIRPAPDYPLVRRTSNLCWDMPDSNRNVFSVVRVTQKATTYSLRSLTGSST